jgi:putative aldouronate transport system substrate-binding protein
MRKSIVMVMTIIMLFTMLAGCGSNNDATSDAITTSTSSTTEVSTTAEPQEVLKCKYVLPGTQPVDYEKVAVLINTKMKDDGIGVELERQYIPWDAWDQKTNIMLSTGEEFDLINVMNDRTPLSSYVGKGALSDITDAILKYGDNIKKLNPDIMMNATKINGKMYAVPAFWVEFSHSPEITLRTDILKEYGLQMPKNFDELTSAFETVMKNWKGKEKPYLPIVGSTTVCFGMAQKSYDAWPFWIYDQIFYVNQDGTVKAYYETEEFKKDCQNARTWYKKGLINPDVLVFKNEQLNAQLDSGNWFVHPGTYGQSIDNIKKNFPNITVDDFEFINFNPEKPNLRPYGTRNMNAVPVTSKNPETGVKFINWLYANQDNYDLYMYGREGVDFKKVGEKRREDIVDQAQNRPLYYNDDWMIGNLTYLRPSGNTPTTTNKMLFNIDETAINAIAGNFAFDATNVKAELANVRTEIAANIAPIACGVLDYDKAYPAAIEKLKNAGLEKVIDEYKKQFEAFRQSQGK